LFSSSVRRRVTLMTALVVALISCSDDRRTRVGAPTGTQLTRLFPQVASLLTFARKSPPIRAANGFALGVAAAGHIRSFGHRWVSAAPPLAGRLGRRGDEPLQIAASDGSAIAIHHVGGGPKQARLEEGVVAYEDAFPGVDAFVMRTEKGIEELLVARDPAARIAYDVDLPPKWRLHDDYRIPGLVEIRDGSGLTRVRMHAGNAWDANGRSVTVLLGVDGRRIELKVSGTPVWPVAIDPEWRDGSTMALPRSQHTATLLSDGKVLIAGGDLGNIGTCELYDPQSGSYTTTGTLLEPRFGHTATLLSNGQVLISGGRPGVGSDAPAYTSAELYDPRAGTFSATGSMSQSRSGHAAARLADGTVLVTGGVTNVANTILVRSKTAEVYDPKMGRFVVTSSPMANSRVGHTATALSSGRVLVVGGTAAGDMSDPAELYDPATSSFVSGSVPLFPRTDHTATILPSGDVLLVGGASLGQAPAEIYSVATGAFEAVGAEPMDAPIATRNAHTATLLPSGQVLVAGGQDGSTQAGIAVSKLYDPPTGAFISTGSPAGDDMPAPAWRHRATLLPSGRVLMTGGENQAQILAIGRLYVSDQITATGSRPMQDARAFHGAALLQTGKVLVVSGLDQALLTPTVSAELYDPASDSYSPTGSLSVGRYAFTTTLLNSGMVLVAGGSDGSGTPLASAEIYDPGTGLFSQIPSAMVAGRTFFTATLLQSGKVLLVGGHEDQALCAAEIFTPDAIDPHLGTFACTANVATAKLRKWHTATLLGSGKVLVTGGWLEVVSVPPFNDADIFDPVDESFTPTSNLMNVRRFIHVAALLPSGQVLIAGGRPFDATTLVEATATAEIYDPGAGTFTPTGSMGSRRAFPAAVSLASGKVLVAGGGNEQFAGQPFFDAIATAELYDPATLTFTGVGSLSETRQYATLTALPSGGALEVGGAAKGYHDHQSSPPRWTSELFDLATGVFRPAGGIVNVGAYPITVTLPNNSLLIAGGLNGQNQAVASAFTMGPENPLQLQPINALVAPRSNAAAVLLDANTLFVAGGISSDGAATNSSEVFNISGGTFSAATAMNFARAGHTVTRMPSGQVLVAGGQDHSGADVTAAELYDPAANTFTAIGALTAPRWHHTAALLPSGKVLIAGGQSLGQSQPPGMELYDPAGRTFSAVESPVVTGVTSSSALFSGDVFLAGDGVALRYVWKQPGFEFFSGTPNNPFGVQATVSGDVVLCGAGNCAWLGAPFQQIWMSGINYTTLDATGATAIRLPNTKLLVLSPTARDGSYTLAYQTSQDGVIRPIVTSTVVHNVANGLQVTVSGSGFTRATARGSTGALPDPSIAPVACFVPDQGGGPIYSPVVTFTDTSLEWLAPTTTYHGPGRLHVIINGVPSEGYFLMLPPATNGTACDFDSDCATGVCVAGAGTGVTGTICCDRPCDSACESCRAADQGPGGVDGTCGPIAAGTDPRNACQKQPQQTCQQTGLCDGNGSCECIQCRSNLDCSADEVCAPDGRCEPFRQAAAPADPGCNSTGRTGSSQSLASIGLWIMALSVARSRSRRPAQRHKRVGAWSSSGPSPSRYRSITPATRATCGSTRMPK
jgi:hypothetical protein